MTSVPPQAPVEDVKPSLSSENVKVERPRSPEANCAICLEEVQNRCYTDTCQHQFCFNCLFEWSKVKPECPLCKQIFSKIIPGSDGVNVGLGEPLQIRPPSPQNRVGFNGTRPLHFNVHFGFPNNQIQHPDFLTSFMFEQRQRQRRQWTAPNHHFTQGRMVEDWRQRRQQAANDFRRYVYRQGLWVRPGSEQRVRDSTPEFYRLNPAQTHRLVPWLQREFNVLLDVTIDSASVIEEVLTHILVYPINSPYFNSVMRPYLGPRTEHFQHEFYSYATSPFSDLFAYDLRAEYGPNTPTEATNQRPGSPGGNRSVISSTSSDSDIEVTTPLNRWGPVLRMDFAMDILSAIGSGNNRPDREIVIELSDDDDDVDVVIETNNNIQSEEVLSDSDSVEIVGVVPPRHLRTPEVIDIASSSDEGARNQSTPQPPDPTRVLEVPGTSRMTTDEAYERSRRSHYSPISSDDRERQTKSKKYRIGKSSSRRRRILRQSESSGTSLPPKKRYKRTSKTPKVSINPRPEGYNTRLSARRSPKSSGDSHRSSKFRRPQLRSVVCLVRRENSQDSPLCLSDGRSSGSDGSDSEPSPSRSSRSAAWMSGDESDSDVCPPRPQSLRHHRPRYYFSSDTDLEC